MITKDKIAAACRAHDNAVDIGSSVHDIMSRRGVAAKDAVYVAQQRALRLVLLSSGRGMPNATKPVPVSLSPEENALCDKLAAAWLDGFAVGLKCKEEP